jgi:hypothetical protein
MSGFQCYCSINQNRLDAGDAVLADAPAIVTPVALLTATITLGGGVVSVAFTTSPLPAGTRLFGFCSPQRSAGRSFEGTYRLIGVSAAAATSPLVLSTAYIARFGTPVTGNRVFFKLITYNGGFVSGPLFTSQVST